MIATQPAASAPAVPLELPQRQRNSLAASLNSSGSLSVLLSGRNTAVVGPAGMGKTALAAKAVREVVGETQKSLAESLIPRASSISTSMPCVL